MAGRSLAAREAVASLEADISRVLTNLEEQMTALVEEQRRQGAFIAGEAVRLAGLIARRVMPAMAQANALMEIEALIAACLGERPEEPRLVIRLPDHLLDPVSARMERLVRETGFAGKPVLLADPKLGRCEACVEWANGGAEWNFERQLGELEQEAVKLSRPRRKLPDRHAKEIMGEAPEQESKS